MRITVAILLLNIILPVLASRQQNNQTPQTDILVVADPGLRKIYGTNDPEFTYTITSGTLSDMTLLTGKPERIQGENAGIYEITQGSLEINDPNYNLIFVQACFTINPAQIIIQAENTSKEVGAKDPELHYTIEGELPEDLLLTGSLTRSVGELPGKYIIQKGSLSAGENYDIIFIKGYLTIEEAYQAVRTPMQNQDIYVYPNPADCELKIINYNGGENIQIFDVYGRQIANRKFVNCKYIDVSGLFSGIYFIKIKNSMIKFVKK